MIIKGIIKTKETCDPTRTILYLLIKKSPKNPARSIAREIPTTKILSVLSKAGQYTMTFIIAFMENPINRSQNNTSSLVVLQCSF